MNIDYAFICESDKIDRKSLHEKANNMAAYLISKDIDRVLIYGHKSTLMFICILACLKARFAYIICDKIMPKHRIKYIINDSRVKLALCTEDIELDNLECLFSEEIETIINTYYPKVNSYNNNQIAYKIYTSGTTGNPKGIEISYENLKNFLNWFLKLYLISSIRPKIILNQALFSFDLSVIDIYYSLINKSLLYCLNDNVISNYKLLFEQMNISNAEMAIFTPSFAELCLCDKKFTSELMPNLKIILFCGEVLKPIVVKKIMARFEKVHIINAYGPSEATCCVSAIEITKEMLEYDKMPIGNINNCAVDIKIVNENAEFLDDLNYGEIILSGKSVAGGYSNSDNTSYRIIDDKTYYFTGDIGHIDKNVLYFDGRYDTQIKYKGYRIELNDIENNLYKINEINQAAVTIKTNDNNDIIGFIAYVVCNNKEIDSKYIFDCLKKMLPEYLIPKSIVIVDKIPLNINKKQNLNILKTGVNND